METIVVGLDPSPSGQAALHWAAEQARLTGRRLEAINAVPVPPGLEVAGVIATPGVIIAGSDLDVSYRDAVAAIWDSASPEPDWTLDFVSDNAGSALVARSSTAALLVVGTHEHVGLARLVSGSVSRYCLSHAHCPTVIVPVDPDRSRRGRRAAREAASTAG